MKLKGFRRLSFALLALTFAGCSGGTRSAAVPPQQQAGPKAGTASVQIRISNPAAAAVSRKPAYVSISTKSVSIAVTNTGQTVMANVTPGSPGCVSGTSGVTCTITVLTLPGTATFTLKSYDGLNAQGNLLSLGSATATITLQGPNVIPVALNGVVASLGLVLTPPTVLAGSSTQLMVEGLDAQGNIIVGPGNYVNASGNPVTITVNDPDTTGATLIGTATSATVTGPSNATLTVNTTASFSTPTTFTASAGTLTAATATLALPCAVTTGALFVANAGNNTVTFYNPPFSDSSTPCETIANQNSPGWVAFDPSGNLYVSNGGGSYVSVIQPPFFGPSSGSSIIFPLTSGSSQLTGLQGITFDSSGNLYLASASAATVTVYSPPLTFGGSPSPSMTIGAGLAGTGTAPSGGVALDSSGNLYVPMQTGSLQVYNAPLSNSSTSNFSLVVNGVHGVAVDSAGSNLWVASYPCCTPSNSTVTKYTLPLGPGSAPIVTLTSANGVSGANSVAVDSSGNVYVSNGGNNTVTIYNAPVTSTSSPSATISGVSFPDGLTVH